MLTITQRQDLESLNDQLPAFLESLAVSGEPGRFLPCRRGVTPEGRQAALGFSCFAAKIRYTIGLWERLAPSEQKKHLDLIRSFQLDTPNETNEYERNAFLDPGLIDYLRNAAANGITFYPDETVPYWQTTIWAETRQAIATLAQFDEPPLRPYQGFPTTPERLIHHLERQDWSRPWTAGGQTAAMVVLIRTNGPKSLGQAQTHTLLHLCQQAFDKVLSSETGAYFTGPPPEHGELINGAMKVLTALDWLESPIHAPKKLIDTCLVKKPSPEGCHLVDAIYVLYRCCLTCDHRRAEVKNYALDVLDMIFRHRCPDGGLSYGLKHSQTSYYGLPTSDGRREGDIHGTILLTWALAMILAILEDNPPHWRVIRP